MTDALDLRLSDRIRLLTGQTAWQTHQAPGVPVVTVSDGPHGLRVEVAGATDVGLGEAAPATCFPPAVTLASSWDPELLRQVGAAVGLEAATFGVGVVLGPGMNIKRHPLCGRNFEYFSEDPYLTGVLAAAMVEGIQQHLGACIKHFAANNQETNRFVVDAVVDERTLREIYLSAFEHVVTTARPVMVMAAYNLLNGTLCSQNDLLLTRILRQEWGFDGVVVSDWGAVSDRVAAVAAGLDLEMPGGHGANDKVLADAVASGELAEEAVTASAQRIIDLGTRVPLSANGSIPADEHDALARRAAAAGAVLLTNDGTLPLAQGTSIALIGEFAQHPRFQGAGSSQVNAIRVTTAYDALVASGADVTYAQGWSSDQAHPQDELIQDAVQAATNCDAAVVLAGLPPSFESEGFDRQHLGTPESHDALIRAVAQANPRTVVVLTNGSPIRLAWQDEVAAILECYLGGQAGGGAVADLLLGAASPDGRLAESFPLSLKDVPADPYFPGEPHQVEYREGQAVGYRSGAPVAFPFGHGLSYTTFGWGTPQVEVTDGGARVTVEVTNTGERAGAEVVHVYLSDPDGVAAPRPERWLGGFAKVSLDAGASQLVTVEVPRRSFAVWDLTTASWQVPAGRYAVTVAHSAAEDVHSVDIHLDGVEHIVSQGPSSLTADSDADFAQRLGRPIPTPRPVRPFTRESTLAELNSSVMGRGITAALMKAVTRKMPAADEEMALMVRQMVQHLPLRALPTFSAGKITWRMVDTLVALLNHRLPRRR